MNNILRLFFAVTFFIITPLFSETESDYYHNWKVGKLKGVNSFIVGSTLDEKEEKILGITNKKIESIVKLKLRQCGAKVYENPLEAEKDGVTRESWFEVHCFSMLSPEEHSNIVHLKTELSEYGLTERGKTGGFISLWRSAQLFNYGNEKKLGQAILDYIRESMEEFADLYLEANPRQFVEVGKKKDNISGKEKE